MRDEERVLVSRGARVSVRLAAVVVAMLVANDARADRLACTAPKDVTARTTKIDAANKAARDKALAAAGLKAITVTPGTPGVSKATGNVVVLKVRLGCNDEMMKVVQFAVDKAGKAYRVMPKIKTTDVGIFACGRNSCTAPCGTPPVEETISFRLPDNAAYSGEREVAWSEQVARISYDVPVECTASGQARTPATPTTGTSELEKLKAENTTLRAENTRLKAENEKLKKTERERVERLQKQVGTPTTQLK